MDMHSQKKSAVNCVLAAQDGGWSFKILLEIFSEASPVQIQVPISRRTRNSRLADSNWKPSLASRMNRTASADGGRGASRSQAKSVQSPEGSTFDRISRRPSWTSCRDASDTSIERRYGDRRLNGSGRPVAFCPLATFTGRSSAN